MNAARQGRWLITGVSAGLGLSLAQWLLERGNWVFGTVRRAEQTACFEALAPGRAHAVVLDMTMRDRIAPAVAEAIAYLGGLDGLINNVGEGLVGAIEELTETEIAEVFEINFFSTLRVTRAALPALRAQGGYLVNITSFGGLVAFPGGGGYCAAKFALEGATEALVAELAPFGIRVMAVEPGSFRTKLFASGTKQPLQPMDIYDATPAGRGRRLPFHIAGKEKGDPGQAAAAIMTALTADKPPTRLVLGSDAVAGVRAKLARMSAELDRWSDLAKSTDLPP